MPDFPGGNKFPDDARQAPRQRMEKRLRRDLVVFVLCCSGCTILQVSEDVRSVISPTYAGSAIEASRVGSARQWILEKWGEPNALAIGPNGRRIDTYIMTQHREAEGLTLHFKRASVLFYDGAGPLKAILWPSSKKQFKRIETFVQCCRRYQQDPTIAYMQCMPTVESDFKKGLIENGEAELEEARRHANRPYNRKTRARDSSPHYRVAVGNLEVAEGGLRHRVAEIIQEWSELLEREGRSQEAEAIRQKAQVPHAVPSEP